MYFAFATIVGLMAVNVGMLFAVSAVMKVRPHRPIRRRSVLFGQDIAVMLVDMQHGFVRSLPTGERGRIVPNQLRILRICQAADIPVIKFEIPNYGTTLDEIESEFLRVPRRKFITKRHNCGFSEKATDRFLKAHGIRRLFMMGINSDYCVLATAKSGKELGYEIITSKSVISTSSRPPIRMDWYSENGQVVEL